MIQEDGVITAVGRYEDLVRRHPTLPVIGTGREIMLPGFVNAHHHVGLTPLQLGSPDMPLELWWITRMVCRTVDPYLDTLYGAFDMIASGVTTVQHIHGWVPGMQTEVHAVSEQVLRAYQDVGMRASYCYAVREQNRLVYDDNATFVANLPAALRDPMQRWFDRFRMSLGDMMDLFESLHAKYNGSPRLRVQLAPANLHWCSDQALGQLADAAVRYDVGLHIHLLETVYQKEYARRRTTGGAVAHLDRFGLLGERLTIGHGTWLTEAEIDVLARSKTCLCHDCSFNLRLRSGIAPLNHLLAAGVTTAIGLDEAGINDDRDMLQEMRLVLRAHRTPGMGEDVPTAAQVFDMATRGGAKTTGFADRIGEIGVGRAAEIVLMDWDSIALPYLDPLTGVAETVLQRGRREGVRTVICDGVVIFDGRITLLDQGSALQTLHDQLQHALSHDEMERRSLSRALLPHVRAFYASYIEPSRPEPFYRMNARY